MDIRCVKCGEPWDHDTLHDAASEQGVSYQDVARRFRSQGCKAIGWGPCLPESRFDASPLIAAVYELSGDDMDGAASVLADAEWLGLLS